MGTVDKGYLVPEHSSMSVWVSVSVCVEQYSPVFAFVLSVSGCLVRTTVVQRYVRRLGTGRGQWRSRRFWLAIVLQFARCERH